MICPAEGADFFGQDAQIFHECFDKEFSTAYGGNDTQKIISAKNTGLEWTPMLSEGFYSWKEAREQAAFTPIPRWHSEGITHFFPPGFSACHI